MISQNIDGGATEADGGASTPLGPNVATPLVDGVTNSLHIMQLLAIS